MPNQTKTIGVSGDYSTIAAWAADADVSDGWWKGVIIDAAEFNENVTISGVIGTPTVSNYIWLTVDPAVRHEGAAGTTHARIRGNTNGSHVFTVSEDFTRIEYLEIQQDSTASSDEGIRVTSNVVGILVSRCIIWTDQTTGDTDGFYAGNWEVEVSIDNCVIYGWRRAGIHAQNWSLDSPGTQTWNVDYCTIDKCGNSGEVESGAINSRTRHTLSVNDINVYNTAGLNTRGGYADFSEFGTAGSRNWIGTNNACSDTSLTTAGLVTNAQESLLLSATTQASGNYFVVNNIAAGSENYKLLDAAAGNLAYGNAVSRVGSEPDSRQDFSLDIADNLRSVVSPFPDIGASEYTVSGATSINATTATKTYTAYPATVQAFLDTHISATLATKTYTANNAAVSIDKNIAANFAVKNYQTFPCVITLLVDTVITATTATKTYQTFNAFVQSSTDVNINAKSAIKTYQTFNASVQADVDTHILANVATKNYTAYTASINVETNILATFAEKTYQTYTATVDFVSATSINATLASKTYTAYPATVFYGSNSIEARRVAKFYKTYKAVVSSVHTPVYAINSLNETIPHALENADEQQRILIENLILTKALLNEALTRISVLETFHP